MIVTLLSIGITIFQLVFLAKLRDRMNGVAECNECFSNLKWFLTYMWVMHIIALSAHGLLLLMRVITRVAM